MQKPDRCKCGSLNIVYVVQTGRGKKYEAYCENCLPVEAQEPSPNDSEEIPSDSSVAKQQHG